MGIREYFKQHPEEQDLKIQDMTIKDTERKGEHESFDPEQEILPEDWQEMKEHYLSAVNSDNLTEDDFYHIISFIFAAKICFPGDQENLNLEKAWEKIKDQITIQFGKFNEFKKVLAFLKITFPDKFEEIVRVPKFNELLKQQLKNRLAEAKEKNLLMEYSELAEIYLILYPHLVSEINLDQETQQKLKDFFEKIRKFPKIPSELCHLAYYLKVISAKTPLKFQLEKSDFQLLKDFFDRDKERFHEFSTFYTSMVCLMTAAYLKISSAENIAITDQGIDFNPPKEKSYQKSASRRPERKKF